MHNRSGARPTTVAVGGSALFILIYTSGAAGQPKGVEVPVWALASFEAYMRFGIISGIRTSIGMPLILGGLMASLAGSSLRCFSDVPLYC